MIYSKSLMKKFAFLTMGILLTLVSYTQTTEFSQFWKIKASFYKAESKSIQNLSIFELEGNYRIRKSFEIGLHTGYGRSLWFGTGNIYENTINIGLNSSFHILPLIIKANNLKPELYIGSNLGVFYTNSSYFFSEKVKKIQPMVRIYLGFAYYFGRHLGFFIEPGIQKMNEIEFKTHVGISYRF